LTAYNRGGLDGIGIALNADEEEEVNYLIGNDLDHCRDKETGAGAAWAQGIISKLNSYTEVTPSNEGFRIFIRGALPPKRGKKSRKDEAGFECYCAGRYVTGHHVPGTPATIETRPAEMIEVHKERFPDYHAQPEAKPEDARPSASGPGHDAAGTSAPKPTTQAYDPNSELAGDPPAYEKVISRIARSRHGQKFYHLAIGEWQKAGRYDSQSQADQAFANLLVMFLGHNQARVENWFRASALGQRDKASVRPDYVPRTVAKAIADVKTVYPEDDAAGVNLAGQANQAGRQATLSLVGTREDWLRQAAELAKGKTFEGESKKPIAQANQAGRQVFKESDPWPAAADHAFDKVEPFPLEVYPEKIARFVKATAESIGCPVDFPAAAVLPALGAAIGYSRALRMSNGWTERPIIYLGIVSGPGSNKTAALNQVKYPFDVSDSEIHDENDRLAVQYKRDLKEYKKRLEEFENNGSPDPGREPARPHERQLLVDDATKEALGELLANNPRGLFLVKDELTSWVDSMDVYRQGRGSDKQFFMTCWSGGPFKTNRRTGDRRLIRGPHSQLNIVGNITPRCLRELSAGSYGSDGFLDRILFTFPAYQPPPRWSAHKRVPQETANGWYDVVSSLLKLEESTIEDKKTPYNLLLDDEAEQRWAQWHDGHLNEAHPNHMGEEGLDSAWHKIKGYAVRFALILHEARKACGESLGDEVDAVSIAGAIRLADYFKSHIRKVHAHVSGSDGHTEHGKAIIAWIQRGGRRTFQWSELWNNLKRRFKKDQTVAREELLRLSRLIRRIEAPNGAEVYQANPCLFAPADYACLPDLPESDAA
jgi:hypothetical protein